MDFMLSYPRRFYEKFLSKDGKVDKPITAYGVQSLPVDNVEFLNLLREALTRSEMIKGRDHLKVTFLYINVEDQTELPLYEGSDFVFSGEMVLSVQAGFRSGLLIFLPQYNEVLGRHYVLKVGPPTNAFTATFAESTISHGVVETTQRQLASSVDLAFKTKANF